MTEETPAQIWNMALGESIHLAVQRIEHASGKSGSDFSLIFSLNSLASPSILQSPFVDLTKRVCVPADREAFATAVLQIGLKRFEANKDTLQDLYFRITTGQNPIIQENGLPVKVCEDITAIQRYEDNRRISRLTTLEEAWDSDWQEHLPLPKTAIGTSKLRVLAKLATTCKGLGQDINHARQFIAAEIAKREPDPDDSEAIVSRKEIQRAIKAMQEDADRMAAEADQQRLGQEEMQRGGSEARATDDDSQGDELRGMGNEGEEAGQGEQHEKAGESSKMAAGDGAKAEPKGKRPIKPRVSVCVCPDAASRVVAEQAVSLHQHRKRTRKLRSRNNPNHCGNVEQNMDPEDYQSCKASKATRTPSVNVFSRSGKQRCGISLTIT